MEDAVGFDVLGMIDPDKREEAIRHLVVGQVFPAEFGARKAVTKSFQNGSLVRLAKSVGWETARNFGQTCDWADQIVLCQEGIRPTDEDVEHCDEHGVYFGGMLACPVCEGAYRE